jgi:hypothetical protein
MNIPWKVESKLPFQELLCTFCRYSSSPRPQSLALSHHAALFGLRMYVPQSKTVVSAAALVIKVRYHDDVT